MRSVWSMKTAKIGCIVLSAALCVLGVLLMAIPEFSLSLLGIIGGVLLILLGAVRLVGYFSKDLYRLAFQYDLASGILLVVLGIIIALRPASLMTFLCIALGFFILTDGLFKLQISLEARRFGVTTWWVTLALALLAAVCGLSLMLRPAEGSRVLMALLGLTLLSEGILGISTMVTAVKIIKHQQPDVIDVTCYRERED